MTTTKDPARSRRVEDDMRRRLTSQVADGRLELPVLPEIAARVLEMCSDPDVEFPELARVIQRDQALSAHIFRLANSALLGASVEIASLPIALSRLGHRRIREMALAVSCKARVFQVEGHDGTVRASFRHSLAAAGFAQEVARRRRMNVGEAFTAGLLHDVGRPIILQAVGDMLDETGEELAAERMRVIACDLHQVVGAALIDSWKLPTRLAVVVRHHHDPAAAGGEAEMARCVRLADDLSKHLLGDGVSEEDLRAHPELAPLNIYPEDLDAVLDCGELVLELVESVA